MAAWVWKVNPNFGESIVCNGYTVTRHVDYAGVWANGCCFSAWSPREREDALGYFDDADDAKAACLADLGE